MQRHRLAGQQHQPEREEREALEEFAHRWLRLARCRCGEALEKVEPYRPQPPDGRARAAQHGLERIVKLASNEGAFGPLPEAVAAYEAAAAELNRYPDAGAARAACAARGAPRAAARSR